MSDLLTRTANVIAEEQPNGAWLVIADGIDGRWFACSDSLRQAIADATYASMIGEAPDNAGAVAHENARMELFVPETGEYIMTGGRAYVIGYARELRAQG